MGIDRRKSSLLPTDLLFDVARGSVVPWCRVEDAGLNVLLSGEGVQ
jgi:hypothetical protein